MRDMVRERCSKWLVCNDVGDVGVDGEDEEGGCFVCFYVERVCNVLVCNEKSNNCSKYNNYSLLTFKKWRFVAGRHCNNNEDNFSRRL